MARVLTRLAMAWLVLCGTLITWALFSGGTFEKGAWITLPVMLCGPAVMLLAIAWVFAPRK